MTDTIDLGALAFDEGFFLTRDPAARREPYPPGSNPTGAAYRHVFTYAGSRQTIKEAALELVRSAKQKVFLASYLLGEADLLDELFAASHRLRGGVYVISELSGKSLYQKLAELEDATDPDAAVEAHKKNFAQLTGNGILVRGHPDVHAKFLVVDDRAALVSSANLDTNGLNSTGENGAFITAPAEVDRLARFFTRLWDSCTYVMPAGSQGYSVRAHDPAPSRCRVPVPDVTPHAGVIWTYGREQLILGHLHDVIDRARHHLILSTYSLNGLTEHPDLLVEPLERALARRSARVWLLCRGRNNVRSQRRDATLLADLGVRIYADSLNHAKGVIADDRHGALFSANFDGDHGLLNGVEVGIRLDGEPMLLEAVRYFGHAMEHADLEFVRRPLQRQLDRRLAARWRTPWPFESRLRIRASTEMWQRFREAVKNPPVLYARESNSIIRLYAGEHQWLLPRPGQEGVRTMEPVRPDTDASASASELLERWLSPPRGRNDKVPSQRGFCPAVVERVRS